MESLECTCSDLAPTFGQKRSGSVLRLLLVVHYAFYEISVSDCIARLVFESGEIVGWSECFLWATALGQHGHAGVFDVLARLIDAAGPRIRGPPNWLCSGQVCIWKDRWRSVLDLRIEHLARESSRISLPTARRLPWVFLIVIEIFIWA